MAGKRGIFANFLSKSNAQAGKDNVEQVDKSEPAETPEPQQEGLTEEAVAETQEGASAQDVERGATDDLRESGEEAVVDEGVGETSDESADEAEVPELEQHDVAEEAAQDESADKDAKIAELEKRCADLAAEVEELRKASAAWAEKIQVVKQGYESLEAKLVEVQRERDHLDGVRLSLERANARLVAQNKALEEGGDVEMADDAGGDDEQTATVKYEVLYTPPDPEIHEAIEDSAFFGGDEKVEPPSFHMPSSTLFRR